jgi:hypothetical protein
VFVARVGEGGVPENVVTLVFQTPRCVLQATDLGKDRENHHWSGVKSVNLTFKLTCGVVLLHPRKQGKLPR